MRLPPGGAGPGRIPGRGVEFLPPGLQDEAREKLEEVPCVTLDADRGLDWTLGQLPTGDQVYDFMRDNVWLAPFGNAFKSPADLSVTDPWWVEMNPAIHAMPYPTWATPLSTTRQRVLLGEACGLLRTNIIGQVAIALKQSDGYPEDWGRGPNEFRSTTERLFDRLRLNGIQKGTTYVRYGTWYDVDGNSHSPRETVFGLRGDKNAFYRFRKNLSADGGSPLGTILGLTLPDSFCFPLDWTMASETGLSPTLGRAQLGENQREVLEGIADVVEELIGDIRDRAKKPLDLGLITRIIEIAAPVVFGAAGLAVPVGLIAISLLAKKELNTLADALEHMPGEIRRAAKENVAINEVGRILLGAVDALDLRGVIGAAADASGAELDNLEILFGLTDLELQQLADALGSDAHHAGKKRTHVPLGFPNGQPVEMILLGDLFEDFAREFGEDGVDEFSLDLYAEGAGSLKGHQLRPEEEEAYAAWRTFWNAAKPCVDVAKVFDLAGLVLERLLYLDDAYLALNDLVIAEGVVGDFVQRTLADLGLSRISDALGGASPGAVLRYLFRQALTDYFIETMVDQHGASRSCLQRIFCWMGSKKKRDAIDAALGPVVDFQIGTSNITVPLRAAFTPVPPSPDTGQWAPGPSTPQGVPFGGAEGETEEEHDEGEDRGALGAIWAVLSEGTEPEALDGIGSCDLARVRDWLELARQDCLRDLETDLQPEWGRNDYDPPVREPDPDDIEIPKPLSAP